ncbi:MAG: 16S rRNA (cytosine(1402)-N(4))-methyltransferase RsmH [Gemmatimonadales bacterium]|nr:16S rRNA (cytosine(1402)-N(4))-methyltransferase RsmH [Gemmatimonadales bacterium]
MAALASSLHVPVLLPAVLAAAEGAERAVDATLGDGGHTAALLGAGLEVLGIDRDPDALAVTSGRLAHSRLRTLLAPYHSAAALSAVRDFKPGFVLMDLGVSSRQLDAEDRGFTFRPGAPLNMRMSSSGPTAADFLNEADEAELAQVFADYGDERQARRLAREVTRRRDHRSFAVSDDLVNAIRAVLGPRAGPPDFARLFQAVRIAVNEELPGLEHALPAMRDALLPGGRLAVISYHSGEDRVVKHAFREWGRPCICPPRQPICTCRGHALGRVEPKKPILPDAAEIAANPRARSARLRGFVVGNAG